ncbi:MAG: PQQ-binding-like beta-propeller repeat protein [Planctomycetes bacterium]|nr:PQQ-binding-like beta-propeller repeat protein [Planctomycetota bacterium]
MKHRACFLLPVFVWLLSFCTPGAGQEESGQEWTRFRGPNGSGVSEATTIPTRWTSADYRWRVKLPGRGHSSPVVWGNQVFVTSGIDDDATLVVRCLDTSDGRMIWERRLPSMEHPKHEFNSYASSTPTVDKDRVYVTFANPERHVVLALDRETGRDLWRRDLGPFLSQHGHGASPILHGDLLIVANEQDGPCSIVGLNRKTGETVWETERRLVKAAFATPCIYRPKEGPPQLIVNSWAHGISSLDPATGKPFWELDEFTYRVASSPAIASGLIFGSCGVGGVGRQMIAVRPGNPATGAKPELAYKLQGALPYVCTPVAYGDLLFSWFDRGVVTCLDAPTGKVHWQERVEGNYFCSPIRVGDRLFCITRDGEMVVLAASTEFEELTRIDLEEPTHATPAVAGGVMYLRTESHVMAIGGKED